MPRQVTAFSNSTVKRLRSLRDKKGRRSEALFLAEGLRILVEARDMNEAVRLAAGIPMAEMGTIEVRPVYLIPTPPEKA